MVYVNASQFDHNKTSDFLSGDRDTKVSEHRNIGGDNGIDRHDVTKTGKLPTSGRQSLTVLRKQFHVVAVAVFLPGLLMDINMLRVAVSCSLVVFVLLEVCAGEM